MSARPLAGYLIGVVNKLFAMFTSLYNQLEDYILNTFHTNECKPWWGGSFLPKGYGQVWHNGTMRKAHQLALELYTGEPLGDNDAVLHSCDNAPCVNPRHLSYGTNKENSRQARDRNRMSNQKLNWANVKYIREQVRTRAAKQKELAEMFGVSVQNINDIVKGRTWVEPSASETGITDENENGGSQSKLGVNIDLLPFHGLFEIMACLTEAASKYKVGNWRKISVDEHTSHALIHLLELKAGNTSENHLQHAATRLMMALEVNKADCQDENHCKDIDIPTTSMTRAIVASEEAENYSVSATSPTDPETTQKILNIFGVEQPATDSETKAKIISLYGRVEDPAPEDLPMYYGDFFGEDNDKEYPIIRTEDKVMTVGLGDK